MSNVRMYSLGKFALWPSVGLECVHTYVLHTCRVFGGDAHTDDSEPQQSQAQDTPHLPPALCLHCGSTLQVL